MSNHGTYSEIFNLLDAWGQLPAYQLERRVDIFFALYLEAILSKFLNTEVTLVAPEFPLKKETSKRSNRVDYLCWCQSESRILLVELKTDDSSVNDKQNEYLKRIVRDRISFEKITSNLQEVCVASKETHKYDQLCSLLVRKGLIEVEAAKPNNQPVSAKHGGKKNAKRDHFKIHASASVQKNGS